MFTVKIDLTGQRFGRLIVIGEYLGEDRKKAIAYWKCLCDCGNETIVRTGGLKSNKTKSCGCLQKDKAREANLVHGQGSYNYTSEYTSWQQMKSRCYHIKNHAYKNYGGRGIKVCDRWLGENGFKNFFEDMGKKPSKDHSLDRFPNKNGDYELSNCRWATELQQQGNRRNNHWIEYNGMNMILQDWARYLGVSQGVIQYHLKIKPFPKIIEYLKNKKVA